MSAKPSKVWIKVPGSCGNLGAGFDVAAAAIDTYLELTVKLEPKGQGNGLPSGDMMAGLLMPALKKAFPKNGFSIKTRSEIPLARGMGSSAAARLAALAAVHLLTKGEENLSQTASETARLEGHPDNAAAAYYGGLCFSWMDAGNLQCWSQKMPSHLVAVLAIPQFELLTKKARQVLPKKVSLNDAVFNLGRMAALMGAIGSNKLEWIKPGLEDRLHQSYRVRLVRGFNQVVESGIKAGADGVCLSGAGPSVLAMTSTKKDIQAIAQAMQKAFERAGVKSDRRILAFTNKGIEWRLE